MICLVIWSFMLICVVASITIVVMIIEGVSGSRVAVAEVCVRVCHQLFEDTGAYFHCTIAYIFS